MTRRALIPTIFDELEDWKDAFSLKTPERWDNSGVSLYENDHEITIEAHVPGAQIEDLDVTFEKGILFIKAETSQDTKEGDKNLKYHMKASSSFSYRISLPNHIDENTAPDAICKNGVLKISFKKSRAAKAQKIEVKPE